MDSTQSNTIPGEWRGLVSASEWHLLASRLSPERLHDLRLIVAECSEERRKEVLAETINAVQFGDDAVMVALARLVETPGTPPPDVRSGQ